MDSGHSTLGAGILSGVGFVVDVLRLLFSPASPLDRRVLGTLIINKWCPQYKVWVANPTCGD